MDALLQLISCFLNKIIYIILIYKLLKHYKIINYK